jgi:hypothetical protein
VDPAEHLPQTLVPIRSLLRHFYLLGSPRRLARLPALRKRDFW